MKIFVSCPFSMLCCEEKYIVKEEYREFFLKLTKLIEANGHELYLAINRENWGKNYVSPEESTLCDYEGVKNSDFLIVIPHPISGGVHVELGWASSFSKKMHILLQKDTFYSPVVMGLSTITDTTYHECDCFLDDLMLDKIQDILKAETHQRELINV